MKKTVNYQGRKVKVEFISKFGMRPANQKVMAGVFIINGKEYPVSATVTPIVCQNGSNGYRRELTFNGYTIPDNDKKMIEYILKEKGI